MQIVDLSHPIFSGMQVFPGDPAVRLRPAAGVPADGFEVAELHLGSHSGTHLDAPRHTVPDGAAVDTLPLQALLAGDGPVDLPFHDVFLGAGGAILENLTNLAAVPWKTPMVSALPLRLAGVDGSPVRAVAFAP